MNPFLSIAMDEIDGTNRARELFGLFNPKIFGGTIAPKFNSAADAPWFGDVEPEKHFPGLHYVFDKKYGGDIPKTIYNYMKRIAERKHMSAFTLSHALDEESREDYFTAMQEVGLNAICFSVTHLTSRKVTPEQIMSKGYMIAQTIKKYPKLDGQLGLVCSANDLEMLMSEPCLRKLPKLCPGIRIPEIEVSNDDQIRVGSPEAILKANGGSLKGKDDFGLIIPVIGRPIIEATNPHDAAKMFLERFGLWVLSIKKSI